MKNLDDNKKVQEYVARINAGESRLKKPKEEDLKREFLEPKEVYERSIDAVLVQLIKEKGIVELRKGVPTIIVSDLHARSDFLEKVLTLQDVNGNSTVDLLKKGEINIVCVGDGMHSESPSNWTTKDLHYQIDAFMAKCDSMQIQL